MSVEDAVSAQFRGMWRTRQLRDLGQTQLTIWVTKQQRKDLTLLLGAQDGQKDGAGLLSTFEEYSSDTSATDGLKLPGTALEADVQAVVRSAFPAHAVEEARASSAGTSDGVVRPRSCLARRHHD